MIDIIKQTPKVYSEESRDYQVIARLYSALFNVSKMYTDNMKIWEPNIDNNLAYLRSYTLNFHPKHTWDLDDLEAITSCFKYLVKYKGTKLAFEYCVNILMKIHKLKMQKTSISTITVTDDGVAEIRIEEDLASIGIIEDLIKYILPAGLTYRVIPFKAADIGDDDLVTQMTVDNFSIDTTEEEFDINDYVIKDNENETDIKKGLVYQSKEES